LEELSQVAPYCRRAEQHRVISHAHRAFDLIAGRLEKLLEESGVEAKKTAVLRLLDSACEFFLQGLLERQDREFLIVGLIRTCDSACQGLAYIFRKNIRVFCRRPVIGQSFTDRLQISNGHSLTNKILKHLLNDSGREQVGYKLIEQLWLLEREV